MKHLIVSILCWVIFCGNISSENLFNKWKSAVDSRSSASSYVQSESISSVDIRNQIYYIGPKDVLEITVLSLKEFEKKGFGDELAFIVNEEGYVNVPLVGLVKAEGKTTAQLISSLKDSFKKFVTRPQVSVVVQKYRSKLVHVLGKVFNNGAIPIRHEKTSLFEIISEAGGFSSKMPSVEGIALNAPDMRHVYVIRNNRKYVVNLYDRLVNEKDDTPFFVEAGDKVFVPEPLETISVLGGVRKAGSFEIKSGLTLLQAIALAGSFTEAARRDQIKVIRLGEARPTHVNAVRIFEGKEDDFVLVNGDIIYVAEW
jgi:polysaccharide export outer membrane protein